jgi:hypothetical protein
VDKVRNDVAESKSEAFGVNFKATVLKRDGTEIIRFIGPFLFGKEDNVGFVYRSQVRNKVVEAPEGIKEGRLNQIPIFLEESRSEAGGNQLFSL